MSVSAILTGLIGGVACGSVGASLAEVSDAYIPDIVDDLPWVSSARFSFSHRSFSVYAIALTVNWRQLPTEISWSSAHCFALLT